MVYEKPKISFEYPVEGMQTIVNVFKCFPIQEISMFEGIVNKKIWYALYRGMQCISKMTEEQTDGVS